VVNPLLPRSRRGFSFDVIVVYRQKIFVSFLLLMHNEIYQFLIGLMAGGTRSIIGTFFGKPTDLVSPLILKRCRIFIRKQDLLVYGDH
jgi:hypothetical protein